MKNQWTNIAKVIDGKSKAKFVKFVKAKFYTIQRFPCYLKD